MGQLEAMGIRVQRQFKTSSSSLNGMEVSHNETTEMRWTLPQASAVKARFTAVKARFTKEGIGKKLVKLFKKELQTGDAAFDRAIYIETDTSDATKAFLANDKVRDVIKLLVETAGPVMIDGASVTFEVFGHQDGDDANATALAEALLGKQQPTA
jgi:hypothetical protein